MCLFVEPSKYHFIGELHELLEEGSGIHFTRGCLSRRTLASSSLPLMRKFMAFFSAYPLSGWARSWKGFLMKGMQIAWDTTYVTTCCNMSLNQVQLMTVSIPDVRQSFMHFYWKMSVDWWSVTLDFWELIQNDLIKVDCLDFFHQSRMMSNLIYLKSRIHIAILKVLNFI